MSSGISDLGSFSSQPVAPLKRYVDFILGNDLGGNGSVSDPWKTLQFAYNSINPTINEPYVIYLSGGNNDTDIGTITGKPNVSLISDYPIQINRPLTISGSTTNDGCTFSNLIFIGAFNWIRNDISSFGVTFNNCQFFSGPVVKQTGAGTASITAINCVFVNLDVILPKTGSFFTGCTFLGSATFGDTDSSAYYEIMGGYTSSTLSVSGGAEIYFSGVMVDVPFGSTLTLISTAKGTPLLQTDSGSIPPSYTGSPTINLISQSLYDSYTPLTIARWVNPQPTTVKQALDRIAAVVGNPTPIP